MTHEWPLDAREVAIAKRDIRIDTESLGNRFVRSRRGFRKDYDVYLVDREGSTLKVRCSELEEMWWQVTAKRFLDALSDAYARLLRAHGARGVEVDLWTGRKSWKAPRALPPFPGRMLLLGIRSWYAQKRFLERADAALAEYALARKDIEDRIAEVRAREEERKRAIEMWERFEQERLREEESRRRREQTLQDTRRQRVWAYAELPGDGEDIVYVYRRDRPPAKQIPPGAQLTEGPLDVAELEAALRALDDHRRRRIVWDPDACTEVESTLRAQGVDLRFDDWWATVTSGEWRTHKRTGRPRYRMYKTLYVTTHHSAYEIRWPELIAVDALFSADGVIGPDAVAGIDGGADGGDSGGSDGGGGGADGGGGGGDGGGGGGD